jgi:hypothetical protein
MKKILTKTARLGPLQADGKGLHLASSPEASSLGYTSRRTEETSISGAGLEGRGWCKVFIMVETARLFLFLDRVMVLILTDDPTRGAVIVMSFVFVFVVLGMLGREEVGEGRVGKLQVLCCGFQ